MSKTFKYIHKYLFIIIIIIIISFLYTKHARIYAQGKNLEFSLSYDLLYNIDDHGNAIIIQKGLLTNLTDKKYIRSLDIEFNSPDIKNISAFDDYGGIAPSIVKEGQKTRILLDFNRPPLGIGKKISFSLSYENPRLVEKIDHRFEITIPRPDITSEVIAYNIRLIISPALGKITQVSPKPKRALYWTKDEILQKNLKIITSEVSKPSPTPKVTIFKSTLDHILPLILITLVFLSCILAIRRKKK